MQRWNESRHGKEKDHTRLEASHKSKTNNNLLRTHRYYRKFIRHYSNITFPLDKLLKNDADFVWSTDCEESFETLKRKLVEAPIFRFTDWCIMSYKDNKNNKMLINI